jgi:hypothetical protein
MKKYKNSEIFWFVLVLTILIVVGIIDFVGLICLLMGLSLTYPFCNLDDFPIGTKNIALWKRLIPFVWGLYLFDFLCYIYQKINEKIIIFNNKLDNK